MYKILLVSIFFVLCVSVSFPGQIQKDTALKGTITDQNGSVVSGAMVLIENVRTRRTYEVATNNVGQFEILVEAGVYVMTASKLGFCPQRRSAFEVGKTKSVSINISLFVCSIESVLIIGDPDGAAMRDRYAVPFKQDLVGVGGAESFGDVHIQYGEKTVLRSQTAYGPIRLDDESPAPVRLTYNNIQVYASSVKSFSNNLFVADGNVIFENGVDRFEFDHIVFLLYGGTHEFLCTITKSHKN